MSKEGYLQTKIQDLNEKVKTLEEKEKYLSIKYDKVENLLNNEVSTVLKDIEHIKKTEQEIKELPEKVFKYVSENLDEIIQNKFMDNWKVLGKELKATFVNQSKINAKEFNQMAKKYIVNTLGYEAHLGAITNVLFNKKLVTKKEFEKWKNDYEKRVKPIMKKDFTVNKKVITGDLKTIDKTLYTDFDSEELIRENKKLLGAL